jgi:uncharacterized membrane protein
MKTRRLLSTKQTALMAVFAALIVITTRLPGIPILGGPAQGGGSIELSIILYPIIGIILGPMMGFVTVLLGNLIAWIIPTSTIFGLLLIPAGAIAAFVSGSLTQRSHQVNWRAAISVLAVLNACWYLTPVGWEAPFYPVLHIAALALSIIFRNTIPEYIHSNSRRDNLLGSAFCCYAAIMADHMFGNLVWISSIGLVIPLKAVRDAIKAMGIIWLKLGVYVPTISIGDIFMLVLPISAVERLIYTTVATFLGVSLIRSIGWERLSTFETPLFKEKSNNVE